MRVILLLIVGALALPAFAGSSSPESTLPGQPRAVQELAERATGGGTPLDLHEQAVDDPVSKEHNNQVDEPDGPPCGEGG
jgi:hypothetical protein